MGRSREQLTSRLALYKKRKERETPGESRKGSEIPLDLPRDWVQVGEYSYSREINTSPLLSDPFFCPFLYPEPLEQNRFIFYDTETTGLSGGAGTRVFLTGFGFPTPEGTLIRQYFLADFPGEREYLEHISAVFQEDALFVSFNGKGYDSHLLTSRFAMNGMHLRFPPQLDLLHPSRRLWKSVIGSCSLGDIESEILGIQRVNDIPGYLIPDVYFDFLRTRTVDPLLDVFHHNLLDISSLVLLLETFGRLSNDPESTVCDIGELGVLLCSCGKTGKGTDLLEQAFRAGSVKAGRRLGLLYKRQGELEKAGEVWSELWERDRDKFGALEMAKYLEHRVKDYTRAASLVDDVIAGLQASGFADTPKWIVKDTEKRRDRLFRKLEHQKK